MAGRGRMEGALATLKAELEGVSKTLSQVEHRLSLEFDSLYGDDRRNPVRLLQRVAAAEEKVAVLTRSTDEILRTKLQLIEALDRETSAAQLMSQALVACGLPPSADLEGDLATSRRILHEWGEEDLRRKLLPRGAEWPADVLLGGLSHVERCRSHDSNEQEEEVEEEEGEAENVLDSSDVLLTPEAFTAVPSLVRRRAKLEEVKAAWRFLQIAQSKRPRRAFVDRSDFQQAGITVHGQTGEAKLATLRHLGLVEIRRDGAVRITPRIRGRLQS